MGIFSGVFNFKDLLESEYCNEDGYDVLAIPISKLKYGDEVLGSDCCWHSADIMPIVVKPMIKIITSAGFVESSFDHEWNIFINGDCVTLTSSELLELKDVYKNVANIGVLDGPLFFDAESIDFCECMCLAVDSEDNQFAILTDELNLLLTHNCAGRMVCGRLGSTASQMALGNSLATAIDGERKGAGIVSVNGVTSNIQYYFEDPSWLESWFKNHGFDSNGYAIGEEGKRVSIDLGDDGEEITPSSELSEFEFEELKKTVDSSKEQKFSEV